MATIYEIVTERILESLAKGVVPWKKDWTSGAISWSTGKPYRGINALLISRAGEYITFNQIVQQGGTLHKGAKSEIVVFYKPVNYGGIEGEDGEIVGGHTFMVPARYYRVFNLADVDGIEPRWTKEKESFVPVEKAEAIKDGYLKRSGVAYTEGNGAEAFYRPSTDSVHMPDRNTFHTVGGFYGTAFHELIHSTGHAKRLKRFDGSNAAMFGSESYGREELVAEIGAAMAYSFCELDTQELIDNSAAYIQSWSKAIKDDPKMIVKASNEAQRAFDYLIGKQWDE